MVTSAFKNDLKILGLQQAIWKTLKQRYEVTSQCFKLMQF